MQDSFYKPFRKHFSIISLFILIITVFSLSCSQKVEPPENVCTLVPEQIPEIRGLRLGMKYDEVKNKFVDFCNLNKSVESISNATIKSISIYLDSSYKEKINTQGNGKCLLMGYGDNQLSYMLNQTNFPELEGVNEIELGFDDSGISRVKITYELTKDTQLVKKIEDSVINTMGLSQWTNWEVERQDNWAYVKSLLCNHVDLSLSAKNISSRGDFLYQMYIQIKKSDKTALTKNQKEEIDKQKKQDELLRNANLKLKEKETRDSFKP